MKRLLVIGLLLFCSINWVKSFHIVGGEIEFITLQTGVYQINLLQYKDEAQRENPNYDQQVTVFFYSNRTNENVHIETLPLQNVTDVEYTNFECSRDELQTSRILYSAVVELDPEQFQDEEGYYIVWERCCRNSQIKNIINPSGTGMKYVLEFPPLWKNGRPFTNSSPILNKPLSDYACINQLYYVDFVGVDLDGDSLVYRLANPLNSSSQEPLPTPKSKPHIDVTWGPGFDINSIVPGERPLRISNKGFLTVNPESTGLYVFSVIVEEWRNKVKIGEMQRDFQLLVVDGCNPPDPPIVAVKIPDQPEFNINIDTLQYAIEDDKCFEFIIANIEFGENIDLRAVPVNFIDENGVIEDVFSINKVLVGANQDTLVVEICAPGCPPITDGPFILDLIASDDACPLPQLDTARLVLQIEAPPNNDPSLAPLIESYLVQENDILTLPFIGTDADPDQLVAILGLAGVADFNDFESIGFSMEITRDEPGVIEGNLIWDTSCQTADFSESQTFVLNLGVDDLDICENENISAQNLIFSVVLPPNTVPEFSTNAAPVIEVTLGNLVSFDVDVSDGDNDSVSLEMIGLGFNPALVGVDFESEEGAGFANSRFIWQTDCDSLDILNQDFFTFRFLAEDLDACQELNRDTLDISIQFVIPENESPQFDAYETYVLQVNQPFELEIAATDLGSNDSVTVRFFDGFRKPNSNSLRFPAVTGLNSASSVLSWTPECDLLDLGENSRTFELIFQTFDDRCPIQASETKSILFEVVETRDLYDRFEPANAFTPNGDGINDFYSMSDLPNPNQNLPPDNCDDEFQYIIVHDRTGTTVFESEDREFKWTGDNVEAGVYYYAVKYVKTEYKGFVQVLK